MSARILTCTDDEYFRDAVCPVPSLSQSIAKVLIQSSPLHAWAEHPRLGKPRDEEAEDNKTFNKGKLFHKLLLGVGCDIVTVAAKDWRTNAAKDARDAANKAGKVPVLTHVYDNVAEAVERIRSRLNEFGIVMSEHSEVKIEWEENGPHGPVLCRGMLDNLHLQIGSIIDVKSCESANPMRIEKAMIDYAYHIQDAAYRSAVEALQPELQGRVDMTFLFCEIEFPYAVTVAQCDGAMRALGESQWQRAVCTWQDCLRSGVWPSYSTGVVPLTPPPWVLNQEMGSGV